MLDLGEAIGRWVMWAVVEVLNLFLVAVGGLLGAVLAVLPGLPELPEPPAVVEQANWFVPVAQVVGMATAWLALYVIWLGVQVLLRWVRAVE